MKYTYMNTIKICPYSESKSYKKGKRMEDKIFDSVKTLVIGILIISSSFLFQSIVPPLLEDEDITNVSNLISTMINVFGMVVIFTGMMQFVNYVRCGEGYYPSSSIFDEDDDNEDEENQLVEDDLETMVSVDAMIMKNKETLDSLSKLNKDSYIKDTTQNETFSKNNDTPKIEYVPRQKSVQMVKCSFCGREKEMGGVCKRCKKC